MQWPGTATAGYRSHEGRVTAADTLQPSVRFGGSIRRQSATAHSTDHTRTSGDCRAWPLRVTCPIDELHYVKRMDAFQDWTVDTARLQLLTSIT